MNYYIVKLNLPITLRIAAEDEVMAKKEAIRCAPEVTTPEMVEEAWDIIKGDGNAYPEDFTEIVESNIAMRPVRFCFPDESEFDGFTDDSTWNGWLNIEVDEDQYQDILDYFKKVCGYNDEEMQQLDIEKGENGRYSLANAFCTSEKEGRS